MSLPSGRRAIDLKFDRAISHAEHLSAEISRHDSNSFWNFDEHLETSSGDLVRRIRLLEAPPLEWALDLGDAIHNARSALDLLAWRLVEVDGGHPNQKTQFPIVEDDVGFTSVLKRNLAGTSEDTRQLVRELKPWKRGNPALYELHRLDIQDKHRMLVPVLAHYAGLQVNVIGVADPADNVPDLTVPLLFQSTDGPQILQDGDEVYRRSEAVRRADETADPEIAKWIRIEDEPAISFAFGGDAGLPLRTVLPGLSQLIESVRSAVEPLTVRVA